MQPHLADFMHPMSTKKLNKVWRPLKAQEEHMKSIYFTSKIFHEVPNINNNISRTKMWDQMKTRLHLFVIGIFLFVVNFYILMTPPPKKKFKQEYLYL
jgi:hypothetical protein